MKATALPAPQCCVAIGADRDGQVRRRRETGRYTRQRLSVRLQALTLAVSTSRCLLRMPDLRQVTDSHRLSHAARCGNMPRFKFKRCIAARISARSVPMPMPGRPILRRNSRLKWVTNSCTSAKLPEFIIDRAVNASVTTSQQTLPGSARKPFVFGRTGWCSEKHRFACGVFGRFVQQRHFVRFISSFSRAGPSSA